MKHGRNRVGPLSAATLVLLAVGGCMAPRDVSHRYNFRELLAGRCFRCNEDALIVHGEDRAVLHWESRAGQLFVPALELHEFKAGRGGNTVTRVPRELAVEFRVTRLFKDPWVPEDDWVEAVFLSGPFAGQTVEVTDLFLAPGVSVPTGTGALVVGPEVEPCD